MAVRLALAGDPPDGPRARRRVVKDAIGHVASYLGNTPTVAKQSYIDPRIIERYEQGRTIRPTLDRQRRRDSEVDGLAALPNVERAVLRVLLNR